MSWNVASIYPHNFPTSWCHLFCEVHQSLLQQSTPTTWCCHPCASWLGWCSSACKPSPFSSKLNDDHCGQTVLFLFHQTRGHFSKRYDLCPHLQLQTVVCLVYGGFGAVASSLLSSLSGNVDIGLVLLWIEILLYLFPPASSQVHSSLGDRTRLLPEWYDGCVVPWCLYLRTIVCTDERGTFRHL